MPYIKKVKLPNNDTIYNIYDDEAAHMSDEPVFALEDSEDIYADTINADTFGGRTPDEYVTKADLTAREVGLLVYPVGSIYMSVNSASPATIFGGTWEQLEDRFLLGAGDTYSNGATGGEAEHTLTEAELPTISGSFQTRKWYTAGMFNAAEGVFSYEDISGDAYSADKYTNAVGYQKLSMNFGSGEAHNNMPPYLAVYMWKRTA